MDSQQVPERIRQLEAAIKDLLTEFTSDTGLLVSRVDPETIDVTTFGHAPDECSVLYQPKCEARVDSKKYRA